MRWFLEIERKARLESKAPVLVLSQRLTRGKFVVIRLEEYQALLSKAATVSGSTVVI